MTTVAQIFNNIKMMNPKSTSISSMGEIITEDAKQLAQFVINETIEYLPAESLAMKIIREARWPFTEKQLWVVAYELLKNPEYVAKMEAEAKELRAKESAKMEASKQKLQANKANSQSVLDYVKNQGCLLGDYYKFLKSNKKFTKEFFSKKFTMESAICFVESK